VISAPVSPAMRAAARGNSPAPACDEEAEAEPRSRDPKTASGKALFFSSDQIGRGDETLGRLLLLGLLRTVGELDPPPRTIVLMNSGVRLATENNETVELLRAIESRGVEVLVCGTCLDYYHLMDRLRAGRVSNLYEITSRFLETGDVVTVS